MRKLRGFTLIELMIVVAIIGILAAIAYPSYMESVRKTRFSQAKEGAMQVASQLERLVSQSKEYEANLTRAPGPDTDRLSYTYNRPDSDKGTYSLIVKESTERFGLWVAINSSGTRCACDGKVCKPSTAGSFAADQKSCTSPTVAF